ncbi:hypothetical protein C5167_020884 [Papaver somniferum]|uniref:Uncharacterized protein n=1 Tax=Papaver somniferum TaxID=3469 RepID=A0A4Y7IUU8_PAPSO|nr:hypothetical protein C5167_020884 [Papaver somniferum]
MFSLSHLPCSPRFSSFSPVGEKLAESIECDGQESESSSYATTISAYPEGGLEISFPNMILFIMGAGNFNGGGEFNGDGGNYEGGCGFGGRGRGRGRGYGGGDMQPEFGGYNNECNDGPPAQTRGRGRGRGRGGRGRGRDYNRADGQQQPVSSNSTLEASFSPDGAFVVSSSGHGSVYAWSVRTGKEV